MNEDLKNNSRKRRIKIVVALLVAFFAFSLITNQGNYELTFEKIEAGTWVDLPVVFEEYDLAAEVTQYIDATQTTTYGTITNGPPNGMGADSAGPTGDTELLEASYSEDDWSSYVLSLETFGSTPAGWSFSGCAVSGGVCDFTTSLAYKYAKTPTLSTTAYLATRIEFDWKAEITTYQNGYKVTGYTPSSLDLWTFPTGSLGTGWHYNQQVTDNRVSSGHYYRINSPYTTGAIHIDNVEIRGKLSNTYYRMDFVFRFDSVTTGLASYTLYVDFYTALSGSDDLDMYIEAGDSTPDAFLCANDKQDDFSVDVTSYITGSTVYLRIFDDYRSGDTSATTAYIQRIYLYTANSAPQVDTAPTCPDLDNGDNIYAKNEYYSINVNVSDADGYDDIDYVYLYWYENTHVIIRWIMKYDVTSDSFSEQSDTNGYVTMSGSSATRSGNDIDMTFEIMFDWDHPEDVDCDLSVYVRDDDGATDLQAYESNYDVETDLVFDGTPIVYDYDGTSDRGSVDGTFYFNGQIEYSGWADNYPDSAYVDVWVSCTVGGYGTNVGPWEDDTIGASGSFSVTCYADDLVGIETYNVKVVEEGAGAGASTLATTTPTDTYIADQMYVSSVDVTDYRINLDDNCRFDIYIKYAYDDTYVNDDGEFTISGKAMTNVYTGRWYLSESRVTVGANGYSTMAGNDGDDGTQHGVDVITSSPNIVIVWDEYKVYAMGIIGGDERINVGTTSHFYVGIYSVYDAVSKKTGTMTVEGISATYVTGGDYDGFWQFSDLESTVLNNVYDTIVISSDVYGVDQVNMNGFAPSVTWDQIQVVSYGVSDSNVDLNTNVDINVTLIYDYDDTAVTTGTITINGYSASHLGSGVYEITRTSSSVTSVTYNLVAGTETTYGLSTIDQNGQSTSVIWNKVKIYMTANMTWSYVGYYVQIFADSRYMYDNSTADGTFTIYNGGSDQTFDVKYDTIGERPFYTTAFTEDGTYGITGWESTTVNVIWDQMQIPAITKYWTQESETSVWLHIESGSWYFTYDSDPMSEFTTTGDSVIRAYRNGTDAGYSIISATGGLDDLVIGPFDQEWWYVNISLFWQSNCQGRTYNISVVSWTIQVDVLHSLQLVNFQIVPTDRYFWIIDQTNLLNASIIVWDDAIDSGTLFADNIYYATYEGLHSIPRSSIIGEHNVTICISSTGIQYNRTYDSGYYVWWYNFTYGVSASSYNTKIVMIDNLFNFIPFETFEVYVNSTRIYQEIYPVIEGNVYNVTVKNRFGDTVNSTIFSPSLELVVVCNIYSLKFMSWYEGFCEVNITRAGITYTEIIMPLEIVEFTLYSATYFYTIDYLNGTTVADVEINLTASTGVIVTGDTITDLMNMTTEVMDIATEINVTITNVNSQVVTISIDLSNVNTTIFDQTVNILTNIDNIDSTIGSQTVEILAELSSINSTLYSQTVSILTNLINVNTTLYSQTVSILSTIESVNTTLYSQTLSILTDIYNVNTTLYSQTVSILSTVQNINTTLYTQTLSILTQIYNMNSTIYTQTIAMLSNIEELNATLQLVHDPETLHLWIAGHNLGDTFCDFSLRSTFNNATLTIFDNNVQQTFPVAEGSTLRYTLLTSLGEHNLSVLINASISWIWYNITYTNAISTTTTGEMLFAFRTTSGLDIGFYTVNVSISYGSTTVILADRGIVVPITETFNITIKNMWGVVIYTETGFNYTSHKWITLPLYEFYIDNDSEHLVTVKFSYQQTYDNITFVVPRNGRIILLDPAVYRIVFTYYSNHTGSGQLINYFAQTPYYVAYTMNITGNGGIQYTGIGFWDLQQNLLGVNDGIQDNYDQILYVSANLPSTPVIPDSAKTTADAVSDTQAKMITLALTLLVGITVVVLLGVIGSAIYRGIQNDEANRVKQKDTEDEEEGNKVWEVS